MTRVIPVDARAALPCNDGGMRITGVESTDLFQGSAVRPLQVVRVTVEPGGAVPPLGLWLTTVPEAAVEVGSVLTETWKPLPSRVFWAAVSCWPTTYGTETGAAPVDTYSVTRVFAATLLPCGGLELITRPLPTLLLAWSTTVTGYSPRPVPGHSPA